MIDKATVDRILDAADIVEVVSDFVHLRRRGSNYIGLCPFHNEKTPSFSVSRAKGICKCFSCGKGGSAVNFIMEHEQLSYYEALKYLAKKYHIEIKERELTEGEKAAQSERENMLLINDFALSHFEDNLFNTADGRDIGLSYFYERGFNDTIIKKFHLGYSSENRNELYNAIKAKGLNPKFAVDCGLCISNERGIYDRFKGRVMFPVFNIAGKVVAFGGRTLKKDMAKYVNSPESTIYKKSYELYGLYQSKRAIVEKDKCFLVEGYTDVLSMHQAGIENVVASSGTSLTEGQIRLIHRFTDNVTVLYDGDSAGIKASLRGIDLLLAEGLNIKVLLLPDGDDPDSFAKKHNATEFQEYIKENETDFIRFKTTILLSDLENDPIQKARAIGDIVKSISVIPKEIARSIYIKECSSRFEIEEKVLAKEVQKYVNTGVQTSPAILKEQEKQKEIATQPAKPKVDTGDSLRPYEYEVIRYVAKYGMLDFCKAYDEQGQTFNANVTEYINNELNQDGIEFKDPTFRKIFEYALATIPDYRQAMAEKQQDLIRAEEIKYSKGIADIRSGLHGYENLEEKEKELTDSIKEESAKEILDFGTAFLQKRLCSDIDDDIRTTSIDLVTDKYQLSKVHSKFTKIESEAERLMDALPTAIVGWKDAILQNKIKFLNEELKHAKSEEETFQLIAEIQQLKKVQLELSKLTGERVIIP